VHASNHSCAARVAARASLARARMRRRVARRRASRVVALAARAARGAF
jgi:hypothetical protein